jgi:hypothetical protein
LGYGPHKGLPQRHGGTEDVLSFFTSSNFQFFSPSAFSFGQVKVLQEKQRELWKCHAVTLQKGIRGHVARQKHQRLFEERRATTLLQSYVRYAGERFGKRICLFVCFRLFSFSSSSFPSSLLSF